ncbi:MAG TPA: hypothetical protein VGV13_06350 [Methylomirabilota bacterium]|jgi:hypothetical protein|nr:hypothetical protein [Methylomirabilota bacterium]
MSDDGFGQIHEYVRTMAVYSLCGLSLGPVLKESYWTQKAPVAALEIGAGEIIVPKEKIHQEYDAFVKLALQGPPVAVASGMVLSGAGVLGPFGEQA